MTKFKTEFRRYDWEDIEGSHAGLPPSEYLPKFQRGDQVRLGRLGRLFVVKTVRLVQDPSCLDQWTQWVFLKPTKRGP